MHLPDAEKRSKIWDKASVWVVAIAVFIGVCGGSWGLFEQHQLVVSGDNHHAQTVTQNNTIETLLREHSATFAAQKKAAEQQAQYDADVKLLAEELVGQLAAVCQITGADCPPLTIPGS